MTALLSRVIVNPGGLNIRAKPTTAGAAMVMLPVGAALSLVDGYTTSAEGYTWGIVQLPDKRLGYCATVIGGKATLAEAAVNPPAPVGKAGFGFNIFTGSHSDEMVALAAQLKAEGKPLSVAVVINEQRIVAPLCDTVKYVVYRSSTAPGDPDNPTNDEMATGNGSGWLKRLMFKYESVDRRAYLQPANEQAWMPNAGTFWLDAMQYAVSIGRKLAIFAYSIGNPNDEGGTAAEYKWKTLERALTYAKDHGFPVVLHHYSAPGTTAGEMTLGDNFNNWEGRFVRLYNSVPESARPVLIFGEVASENARGKFQGVQQCVSYADMHQRFVRQFPYVAGDALWCINGKGNGWDDADIEEAIPAVVAMIRRRGL